MFPIFCAICDAVEENIYNLLQHIEVYHKEDSRVMKALKFARADTTEPILQQCEPCAMVFKSKWGLQRHQRQVHVQWFRCEFCSKRFKMEIKWIEHQKKFHKSEAIEVKHMEEDDHDEAVVVSTEFAEGEDNTLKDTILTTSIGREAKRGYKKKQKATMNGQNLQSPFNNTDMPIPELGSLVLTENPNGDTLSAPPSRVVTVNTPSGMDEINFNETKPSDVNKAHREVMNGNEGQSPLDDARRLVLSDEQQREVHTKTKTGTRKFVINCTKCSKSFPNASDLISHIKSAHC